MTSFAAAMERYASLPEEELQRPWRWREGDLEVRYALYRSLEEEHEALVRARARWRPTEAEAILALAQRAFGDLRGLLVGVPDDVLDRAPAPGEWPLRATLRHLIAVEKRYATQTTYGAHRREADPLRLPDDRLPQEDDRDVAGGTARILERFAAARAQSDALCGALPEQTLERPVVWAGIVIDVRFRLHRFASHITEHTIQCEKTLAALGLPPTESRRIVRRIWAARGELEAIDDEELLAALDASHAARAAALPA